MNAKNLIASAAAGVLIAAGIAFAQEDTFTFPIAELGECTSKAQCKEYCDDPDHADACLAFAEAHNLMPPEELAQARRFLAQEGPGACRGLGCRAYCEDRTHRDECVAFAKEHGLTIPEPPHPNIDEPEIDEERAISIVESQGGPGGCRTKDECRAYCEVEGNMEACLAFAEAHDLMSAEDLARARAMMTKGGPGGCRGVQCREYCENPDHADECLSFAEKQGFIAPEEAAKARKLMNATGPGGCRGVECKTYCEDPAHQEECFEFAVQNGFISEDEAKRARAFMQGMREMDGKAFDPPWRALKKFEGPGGCSSPEECRAYCEGHPQECRGFRGPDHAVEQPARPNDFDQAGGERTMEMRGFEVPQEMMERCRESPEACREFFQAQGYGSNHPVGEERAMEVRGFMIPPGQMPCTSPEECKRLFEQSGQSGPWMPPEGSFHPPPTGVSGSPPDQEMMGPPPDSGSFEPQPPSSDAPQTNAMRFVASVLSIIAELFGI